tara:strand:- start:1871 stop:2584 length:714 start_codon:yes stop_codon:yes gene_type:complete
MAAKSSKKVVHMDMATNQEISITEGLRLMEATHTLVVDVLKATPFLAIKKGQEFPPNFNSWKDYEKYVKSQYKKIEDLLRHRGELIDNLIKAQSTTLVEVDGVSIPLSQAVALNSSKSHTQRVVMATFAGALAQIEAQVNQSNEEVNKQCQAHVAQILASDDAPKMKTKSIKEFEEAYKVPFLTYMVDPISIRTEVSSLQRYIHSISSKFEAIILEAQNANKLSISVKALKVLRGEE